jgi:hypothetical protein
MAMATAMQRQWQHNHAGHCTQWQWQFSAMKTQYPAIACGRFLVVEEPYACQTPRRQPYLHRLGYL